MQTRRKLRPLHEWTKLSFSNISKSAVLLAVAEEGTSYSEAFTQARKGEPSPRRENSRKREATLRQLQVLDISTNSEERRNIVRRRTEEKRSHA